jgi:CubicO group peptidase (beta-lactamase class C family)
MNQKLNQSDKSYIALKSLLVRIIVVISILITGLISACKREAKDSQPFETVDNLFTEWNNTHSPGCALAIIKDGKILYEHGYGMADLEHDIPVSPNSVFNIASVSKQFVAMCLLLLEEEGKLSLEDNIRKYLPEFPEYNSPITIKNLIFHTSGIADFHMIWDIEGKDALNRTPAEEVFKLICSQEKLDFTPGEKQLYSNSGYFLSSIIIRRVSGKSLKDYAKEKIFIPLGMRNSEFLDDNKSIIKNRACGYTPLIEGGFGNAIMRYDLVGGGGLYSTVEDLYLWDQNFYHNKLGNGSQLLIDKMLTNGRTNDGKEVNYAYGIINGNYKGFRIVQHTGDFGGYKSFMVRFPDKNLSVIVLSNLAGFSASSLAYQVADIFIL